MTGPVTDPAAIIRHARLDQCRGPWLVDINGRTWFDATAGLCSNMLGFNHAASFGVCQFAEAWTGDTTTENIRGVGTALSSWLDRTVQKECAGAVLSASSESPFFKKGWTSPAALINTYVGQSLVDQFAGQGSNSPDELRIRLEECRHRFPQTVQSYDIQKLGFNLRTSSQAMGNRLRGELERLGVLNSSSGGDSLPVFQTPGWRDEDRNWFFSRLSAALAALEGEGSSPGDLPRVERPDLAEVTRLADFHLQLIDCKLGRPEPDGERRKKRVARFLAEGLAGSKAAEAELTLVGLDNWPRFRDRVEAMQVAVYEPARRTSRATFEALLASPVHHAMVLELKGEIIAMVFAASLDRFPNERGTLDDPARRRRDVIYVADLTVAPEFRGGLGRIMKQAITLDAVLAGREAFHGRNRDRLAAGMWAINLGLGSYELKHLVDDYPDQEKYRDCIYYRCPLRWEPALAAKVAAEKERLGAEGFRQRLFELANGVVP
jgi:hypothetical protein